MVRPSIGQYPSAAGCPAGTPAAPGTPAMIADQVCHALRRIISRRVGSLFTGIGGFDLGLERAGFTIRWQVENDPYCNRILRKHWPRIIRYGDIRTVDWRSVEPVDLVCGGFPCQPVSVAGKRRGMADERWLWPEFARCLCVLRPRYILIENVPGLFTNGFGAVLSDLAALGYDAEWQMLSAAAFGAPHLRKRIWIVAYPSERAWKFQSSQWQNLPNKFAGYGSERTVAELADASALHGPAIFGDEPDGVLSEILADSAQMRRGQEHQNTGGPSQRASTTEERGRPADSGWWDIEPAMGELVNGVSSRLVRFRGRVAKGIPNRVNKLRGLGNAVVPQIVEWIGRLISADMEKETP